MTNPNNSLDNAKSSTSLQARHQCTLSNGESSSSLPPPSTHSTTECPDKSERSLYFQQSLLILINLHLLRRLLTTSMEENHNEPRFSLVSLKRDLPTFFKKVGYVSHHFFESALLTTKVFFQTNTFSVVSQNLPQLFLLSSFFGTDVQSVFLHVLRASFNVEKFLEISHIISGLELHIFNHNDLEFLNKSSIYFPRLTQLHVYVSRTIAMELFELLKVNTTVTRVDIGESDYKAEGAIALAEALKVNTTVTSVVFHDNFIESEGATALAEALKVNNTLISIELSYNFIESEGAITLAEALKVNNTLTSVDLASNHIDWEGAIALAI
ncbi:hypothetical protein GEMRC1_010160 [Eukaryota sp. GEM-RC1]